MKQPIIKINKLSKTFSTGGKQLHIIKNLDLEIYAGDFTIIMGSSGSGKSTLLYAVSGMDRPTLGDVYFEDKLISDLNNDKLALFRRQNCGFVFQQNHLLDNMSTLDNILAGGLLINSNKKQVADKAKELLMQVNIQEELWHKFPSQLSGGEAQRVGIVRALINSPKLLFADEPTGSLNSASGVAVLDVFSSVHKAGQSVVMVTHDLKTAARGNRIIYLFDGAISGELNLANFQKQDEPKRIEKLQAFLDEMGW